MCIWFELGSASCSVLPAELVYNISDLFKYKLTDKGQSKGYSWLYPEMSGRMEREENNCGSD